MLDLDKIRHYYFNPPPDDPERVPTREELYASEERRAVERCLLGGGDPRERGLGEHGSLIGGPDKPLRQFTWDPEFAPRSRTPLPLAWFDNPAPDPGPRIRTRMRFASSSPTFRAAILRATRTGPAGRSLPASSARPARLPRSATRCGTSSHASTSGTSPRSSQGEGCHCTKSPAPSTSQGPADRT